MVVKSARRYITALDKILKSQHNDITTKIVEFNDDNIEYIMLNFFIDSKQCFVAAYDYDDIVEYHVDGIDGVIEYKIGDNETHKHSIYTILNRIYDLIVKLEEENNKTKKYYANYSSEDCIENAECARGNDVFDGCKQKPPKGHIYIDTDSVKVAPLPEQQPSEESIKDTIIADDNIAYQTAKVTKTKHSVLDVMQCMMCPADREGNRCGGKQWCKQTWKRYDAIVNPEWHHVSLATLANIDFDILDEKRKLVFDINQILKDGIRNLYKCENHISFEVLERYVIRKCDELIRHNRLKAFWFSYIARQLDDVRRNTIYLYTPYITAHRNRW
jgi:hypothetical protein